MRLPTPYAVLVLLLLTGCSELGLKSFPVQLQSEQPVLGLAYSDTGDRLYVAGARYLAYGRNGAPLGRRLDVTLSQVAVAGEFVYALTAGTAELRLYDPDGQCRSCAPDDRIPGKVSAVVASADGRRVVAAEADEKGTSLWVWRVGVGAVGARARGRLLYGNSAGVRHIALSPDGALLLVVDYVGNVTALDSSSGAQRWRYETDEAAGRPFALFALWNVGANPLVGLSARGGFEPIGQLDPATGALTVLAPEQRDMQFANETPAVVGTLGGRFLLGRQDVDFQPRVGVLGRYDLERRTFIPLAERGRFEAIALSPDGEHLAVSRGSEIDTYDVQDLLDAPPHAP
ncbi:hypothetical protein FGE12_22230 [Aggregicoccus sp. 17bor-14]|uniref:hypothetical protein n=1 Tax=Myxococcaceae TaxID=31 RepID=UPI00129D0410|nr:MULTISPECIES: hypothetical protein [Myxococcaceae]MBF5045137.1 hypothetical protein [Simulacricoccus sp. 17bor-14]MRI90879.1 hypothetical protein [Aggregicoccus sp. 17bor-14]